MILASPTWSIILAPSEAPKITWHHFDDSTSTSNSEDYHEKTDFIINSSLWTAHRCCLWSLSLSSIPHKMVRNKQMNVLRNVFLRNYWKQPQRLPQHDVANTKPANMAHCLTVRSCWRVNMSPFLRLHLIWPSSRRGLLFPSARGGPYRVECDAWTNRKLGCDKSEDAEANDAKELERKWDCSAIQQPYTTPTSQTTGHDWHEAKHTKKQPNDSYKFSGILLEYKYRGYVLAKRLHKSGVIPYSKPRSEWIFDQHWWPFLRKRINHDIFRVGKSCTFIEVRNAEVFHNDTCVFAANMANVWCLL